MLTIKKQHEPTLSAWGRKMIKTWEIWRETYNKRTTKLKLQYHFSVVILQSEPGFLYAETFLWIIHDSVEPQNNFYFLYVKWRIFSGHTLSLWSYKWYAQASCLAWNWARITPSQQKNITLSSKHICQPLRSSLMHNCMLLWKNNYEHGDYQKKTKG